MTFHFSALLDKGYVGIVKIEKKKQKTHHISFCLSSTFFQNFPYFSKNLAMLYRELELLIHIFYAVSKKHEMWGAASHLQVYMLKTPWPVSAWPLGTLLLWADQPYPVKYPCESTVLSTWPNYSLEMPFLVTELPISFSCVCYRKHLAAREMFLWLRDSWDQYSVDSALAMLYSLRKITEGRICSKLQPSLTQGSNLILLSMIPLHSAEFSSEGDSS